MVSVLPVPSVTASFDAARLSSDPAWIVSPVPVKASVLLAPNVTMSLDPLIVLPVPLMVSVLLAPNVTASSDAVSVSPDPA